MSSRDYWNKRESEALKHYIKDEQEYQRQLNDIYRNMLDNCQKEIDAFYAKYAAKENISISEAKKRVSKLDIAAYERKAKKYVKDKDFSAKANEEMRLYNATMKINRLEMLKANIGLELIAGHQELEDFMGGILKGRTEDELKRQAGILGKTVQKNAQKANALVNASFKNATFSDRIWMYQDELKNDLAKMLQSGLIQGKNSRVLAKEVQRRFDVGASSAERLMRTELARVQTEAQKQSFQRNGFTLYEFIVNRGCCPICAGLDGKHFSVEKMMPGLNAPPMHPHCRCSTAPWEDGEEYEAWLDYLDKGGTTEQWNAKDKAIWKSQRRHDKKTAVVEQQEKAQKAKSDELTNRRKGRMAAKPATLEELAESIGKKHGIDIDIKNAGKFTEEAKKQLEAIDKLLDEYNSTMVSFRFERGALLDGEAGGCYMLGGKSAVSVKTLAIKEGFRGTLDLKENGNISVTYHEFAHSLSISREKMHDDFWKELRSIRTRYRKDIKGIDKAEIVDKKISATEAVEAKKRIAISNYAEKDIDEFFAEAFTQGKLSATPSPYAKEVVELVDKYFKKK